jgi:hypothetical protein
MKHVLLTRFAIPFPKDNPRYERCTNSKNWFSNRCDLFEKYTLPSVRAQTSKHFDWILLANPDFPSIDIDRLSSYNIEVLWVDWEFDEDQQQLGEVLQHKYKEHDWIITSRLDNDDMLSNWFMKSLLDNAGNKIEWLTFPNGYIMKGDKAFFRRYPTSPFVSLVEPAAQMSSVFQVSHIFAGTKVGPIRELTQDRAWVQIDHGDNVKNNVDKLKSRGKIGNYCSISELRENFTW